jgi:glutathione peroxidase
MRNGAFYLINRLVLAMALGFNAAAIPVMAGECPSFLNQDIKKLHSDKTLNICKAYAGKPLLIINTASYCGYTPQFNGLEQLHKTYKEKGLVVLGFASNDFNQEANNDKEIANVCFINYGVTFTMFAPIKVTGQAAHPLFKELAAQSSEPAWNFNKYLVNADGKVVNYFDSNVTPDSDELKQAIERALSQ